MSKKLFNNTNPQPHLKVQAIILAAGKGKRFTGEKPKVLQEVAGKTLVKHVVCLADSLAVAKKVVVIGYLGEQVQEELKQEKNISFVWQKEQLGTGHAVKMALPNLETGKNILVFYGDVPAIQPETVQKLLTEHQQKKNVITVLTAYLKEQKWYGRILKNKEGKVLGIREAKDCNAEELLIKEINSGILVVEGKFLKYALEKLQPNNRQGEYYLTDIVGMACRDGKPVSTVITDDEDEIKGVNSPEELAEMEKVFSRRAEK